MVSINYDKVTNSMYIKISDKKTVKTITLGNNVFGDVDKRGEVVGLEILNSGKNVMGAE